MDTQRSRKMHLIANQRSGKGAGASLPDIAKKVASEVGVELTHYQSGGPDDFERKIDDKLC